MDFGSWSIYIRSTHTQIGCKKFTNEEWLKWTWRSKEIKDMHSDASKWWKMHGDVIKSAIKCVMYKYDLENQGAKNDNH
jgi:hypothetical protein